jgi:hypothetical protein
VIVALLAPEITIRVQIDRIGKVNIRYSKWILRPEITIIDFFTWFIYQTGRDSSKGLPFLKFTFKDIIPVPISSIII